MNEGLNKKEEVIEDSDKLSKEIISECISPEEIRLQKEGSKKKILEFLKEVDPDKFFETGKERKSFDQEDKSYRNELNKKFNVEMFSFNAFCVMVDNIQHRLGYLKKDKQLVDYIVGYAEKIGKKDLKFDNNMAYDELLMKLQTIPISDKLLIKKVEELLNKNVSDDQESDWDFNPNNVGSDIKELKWAKNKIINKDTSESTHGLLGYEKI
ncbi:MAG TPA: hypothetical protein VMR49_02250 [Candidatus Paceibacterota bacterium]|nr:hypothetical protein [Candidatus Paceibacterota bacterium]